MRVLLVDNRDSFSHNVAHLLAGAGADVDVVRSDGHEASTLLALGHRRIVISPGPDAPADAGCSLELTRLAIEAGDRGVLGICLGMQCIGVALGMRVAAAPTLVHGVASEVGHDGTGLLAGLASPLRAGRYHSLAMREEELPAQLLATARALDDGALMAVRHATLPVEGVQFHPESVLTPDGPAMAATWLGVDTRATPGRVLTHSAGRLPRMVAPGDPAAGSEHIGHHHETEDVA